MPQFIEKWVEDTARHRIIREIGTLESEWPAHGGSGVESGFCTPDSESCSILLSIPSSRWFKPRFLWVDNRSNVKSRITLYVTASAADASATIGGIWIGARETAFIALDGITVGTDIWVTADDEPISVRIAGILLNSGPEN